MGLLTLTLMTACGQTTPPTSPTPNPGPEKKYRPSTSPDVYLFGISGKCFKQNDNILPFTCLNLLPAQMESQDAIVEKQNTKNNWDYLSAVLPNQTESTLQNLADTIAAQGYTVGYDGVAGSWPDRANTSSGSYAEYYGVKTLLKALTIIYNQDIKGVENPSKVVLVSHSHGVVWSHVIQWALPQLPIEVAVDFDGVCRYWGTDNAADITGDGNPYQIPVSSLCGEQITGGGTANDIQNVVFDNVKWNLEIQADNTPVCGGLATLAGVYDGHDNWRYSGGTSGLYALRPCDNHMTVIHPNRSGMKFVRDTLKIIFPKR
ncbi:hypothetical protein DC3_54040 [Deinococcus cellulosilyticus NBRC 106333 = KACC 11606]|uniref:Uncharacterized protein n=2 Tax=Deinococcus cellulosilyticus TaxID=401558 RepID=A0A511NAB7_DEIC1|nr:hypothetical protein DC3_54040 [Deinococcus cellulosilyticus NBRC 106333 = KACC 11606]